MSPLYIARTKEVTARTESVVSWRGCDFHRGRHSKAGPPPDGESVSFMVGKAVLGTGPLSGGSAIFTTSKLKVGTTPVTAVYAGDADFGGSESKPVQQVVQ